MKVTNLTILMLRELLDFHYDRRELVYDSLAGMKPEDFVRPMGVAWSDIRGTLFHCLRCEEFWIKHGAQGQERPKRDPDTVPDLQALRQLATSVREETEAFVRGLTDKDLGREASVVFSSGDEAVFPIGGAFLHVIMHDTHHRGQVAGMMHTLGYEPPEIDYLD